jgi:hypothetical protein
MFGEIPEYEPVSTVYWLNSVGVQSEKQCGHCQGLTFGGAYSLYSYT